MPVDIREIRGAEGRVGASGIWTGSDVLVWGGLWYPSFFFGPLRYRRSGNVYDPATDTWERIPPAPIVGRYRHEAAWTGTEMLVWGGFPGPGGRRRDGAAYNPSTNSWRTIATSPLGWSTGTVSVTTDEEWIVGVTIHDEVQFAAYDPAADSWRFLPTIPAPMTRENSLAWTGTELVLVNSQEGRMVRLPEGADAWIDSTDVALDVGQIAWTGRELLGLPNTYGARFLERYAAEADEWVDVPGPAFEHGSLIWTGEHVIVHGPDLAFEPATGEWFELAWPEDLTPARQDHVAVWTDHGLFEWGGGPGKGDLYNHGALYSPDW